MRLFHSDVSDAAVLIFGCGLIGSAVQRAMLWKSPWAVKSYWFPWDADASRERRQQLEIAMTDLAKLAPDAATAVHIVWSAGHAGFSATEQQTQCELNSFRQVVEFSEALRMQVGVASHLHMMSSAGGLFEGVRGINSGTECCPARPYGELKAAQEAIAVAANTTTCSIYRPSSVYSTVQPGQRCGLIPTMIWNTLRNQVTSIYGRHDTLRDYIWADDIGNFVAARIDGSAALTDRQVFLLATGIPTPISRIIRVIEEVLMRPVSVQFVRSSSGNDLDITFSPSSLPQGLAKTNLATAIRKTYLQLMNDGIVSRR